ncbi:23S rRNA (adenine(2030)-N(6))-methyltransferase RlmJ [Legionella sp.]|uniref:23S rRNA (adenine(2030)-N(6))-methyltransferase RlmJ n=1 Tax=Legionella sp. TaxID=459 RepID=UPI003C8E190F
MLSYQHGYHAGNFADVIKHVALTRLLNYLIIKEKSLFFLETHAGKGIYDLKNKQAEKTKEYKQGINFIWPERKMLAPVFHEYLNIIMQLNATEELKYYPGSPFLAINQLRSQDRLYFCELHSTEFAALNQLSTLNKKVHFSNEDGITAMNALLPPPEKRGLIFIDPSFEIKNEYKDIPAAIKRAYIRFSTGVFCLWYPIVNRQLVEKLDRGMNTINAKNSLRIEFNLTMARTTGMSGTGLWVINPPHTFAEEMKAVLDTLRTYFNPGISSYLIETN